jgi:hypothetical protein
MLIAARRVTYEAKHGNLHTSRKYGRLHPPRKYDHLQENMTIFKRRLAETKDVTVRGMLLQLLAAEQAKDVAPKSEK